MSSRARGLQNLFWAQAREAKTYGIADILSSRDSAMRPSPCPASPGTASAFRLGTTMPAMTPAS